jgi:flagellar biosynthesis/type III secretory pathway protein FliH
MSAKSKSKAPKAWACFHCDETFTNPAAARDHFGPTCMDTPACQIDAKRLRDMENELERYRNEDTDLHRQISHLQSEQQTALRRAEEAGYAKGLKDGREIAIRFMLKIHGEFHGCLTGDCPHTSNEDCVKHLAAESIQEPTR